MKINKYNQGRCREAVKYEIWMFVETYKRYQKLKKDSAPTTVSMDATSLAVGSSQVAFMHPMQESKSQTQDTHIEKNVYLETFLLHLRNLIEFFYSENPRYPDDIIAKAFYVSEIEYCQSIGEKPAMFSDAFKKRLHKKLAHLTFFRVDEPKEEKSWNVEAIYNAIMPSIKNFDRDQLSIIKRK